MLLSGNEICWVVGKRVDEAFKVDDGNKEVLRIDWLLCVSEDIDTGEKNEFYEPLLPVKIMAIHNTSLCALKTQNRLFPPSSVSSLTNFLAQITSPI